MSRFEFETCTDGSVTLRDLDLGEAMHSTLGPYSEAMALYIEQSRLKERLRSEAEPLVIYDIGLGIATNALAILDHSEGIRPLQIHSFENKLSGLAMAFGKHDQFPYMAPHLEKVESILKRHQWSSPDGRIRWQLHEGDFETQPLPEARPELIYFDFYSPRTSPELWTYSVFRRLRDHSNCATLYTYSASTAVRSALLLAGWEVGYGVSTTAKRETTVASTHGAEIARPLDQRWLHRFMHSTHALPPDRHTEEARLEVLQRLMRLSSV